jgi:hypothetical protein
MAWRSGPRLGCSARRWRCRDGRITASYRLHAPQRCESRGGHGGGRNAGRAANLAEARARQPRGFGQPHRHGCVHVQSQRGGNHAVFRSPDPCWRRRIRHGRVARDRPGGGTRNAGSDRRSQHASWRNLRPRPGMRGRWRRLVWDRAHWVASLARQRAGRHRTPAMGAGDTARARSRCAAMERTRCAASARVARGRRLPPAFRMHSTSGCPRCGLAARWHLAIRRPLASRASSRFWDRWKTPTCSTAAVPPACAMPRKRPAGFLGRGGVAQAQWRERAAAVHRAFIARRLSPGGCADLLAITLFLDALNTRS